ncbi:hypothetical protein CCP1ISM_2690002 [Azospirillaceae bacterium]
MKSANFAVIIILVIVILFVISSNISFAYLSGWNTYDEFDSFNESIWNNTGLTITQESGYINIRGSATKCDGSGGYSCMQSMINLEIDTDKVTKLRARVKSGTESGNAGVAFLGWLWRI